MDFDNARWRQWVLIVSRLAQTQFRCWFESTMATDQNIKSKTLASELHTAYGKYGTWLVHLFLVCKMYKEAITGEFVCSWLNILWTTKTWRYSVLYCHSWKLKTVGTYFIFLDFVTRNLSVILWKLLKLEGVSTNKSIAPEYVIVKASHDLKLM